MSIGKEISSIEKEAERIEADILQQKEAIISTAKKETEEKLTAGTLELQAEHQKHLKEVKQKNVTEAARRKKEFEKELEKLRVAADKKKTAAIEFILKEFEVNIHATP